MKTSLPSILRAGASLSLASILCLASIFAADEPKSVRTTPDNAVKQFEDAVQRLNEALNAAQRSGDVDRGEVFKKRLEERLAELEKAAAVIAATKKRLQESRDELEKAASVSTVEAHALDFKTPRMHAYEAERHSAEKIKAHVRAADAKAKLLLEGSAPSHVK